LGEFPFTHGHSPWNSALRIFRRIGGVRPDINKEELIDPKEVADIVGHLAAYRPRGVVDELRIRRETSDPWF